MSQKYIATIGVPAEVTIETQEQAPYIVEIADTGVQIESVNQTVNIIVGGGNCEVGLNPISLITDVTGILPIIHGGTGSNTGSIDAPGPLTFSAVGDLSLQPSEDLLLQPSGDISLQTSGDIILQDLTGVLRADNGVVSVAGELATTAADVSYTNVGVPALTNVQEALDQLFYVSPTVTLTNTSGIVETGSTIPDIVLNWTLNKTMTSISLNNGIGSITPPTLLTYTHTGQNLTSNRTYTITVGDGTSTATSSSTIYFQQKRYWGVSASSSTPDSAFILALSSEFATSQNQSRVFDCSGGRYFYFAFPTSFGLSSFTVGGLSFTDITGGTVLFTNASGYEEAYYWMRCSNLQNGAAISVTVASGGTLPEEPM